MGWPSGFGWLTGSEPLEVSSVCMLGSGYPKLVIRIRLRLFELPMPAFLPMGALLYLSRVGCESEVWCKTHLSGLKPVSISVDLYLSGDGLKANVKAPKKCTLAAIG